MKNVHFENSNEALETLRLATETAGIGVWDANLITRELHYSELCGRIFGIPIASQRTLSSLLGLVHPEDRTKLRHEIVSVFASESDIAFEVECRVCRPDGEVRWVVINGRGFFEQRGGRRRPTRLLGTVHDRTERILSQHALLQAERLAVTGRLAASIAHEINNPLEAVTNLLFLLREAGNEVDRQNFLSLAESELARVAHVVTHTLKFYRDPIGITEVEISDLATSVIGVFNGRILTKQIDLRVRLSESSTIATAAGELRQVLVNLVSNALDALPIGGRLFVRCRKCARPIGKRPVGVSLCVADTGAGIPQDVLPRIFEPFYTTKGDQGTGLGLWLSMELLKKHGYRLRVRSKPYRGTVFWLYLPANHGIDA